MNADRKLPIRDGHGADELYVLSRSAGQRFTIGHLTFE